MTRAVAVSPRPGDAVLACGATLAGLAAGGWHVTLVTVHGPGGPRPGDGSRDEDAAAAERLGLAAAVAVGVGGTAAGLVAAALGPVLDEARPDRVLAPLGDAHRDAVHAATVEALAWLGHPAPLVRWRDVPAGLGEPPRSRLPGERGIPVAGRLGRKLDACAAYAAVVDRLGGDAAMREALTAFHAAEGRRLGLDGPAEALVEPPPDPRRERARRAEVEREERAALARLRAQLAP